MPYILYDIQYMPKWVYGKCLWYMISETQKLQPSLRKYPSSNADMDWTLPERFAWRLPERLFLGQIQKWADISQRTSFLNLIALLNKILGIFQPPLGMHFYGQCVEQEFIYISETETMVVPSPYYCLFG